MIRMVGLGDTRAAVRVTLFADKLIHRLLTLGVSVSFPIKTVHLDVDTGRTWSATPNVLFTRTYLRLFWQVIGLASVEHRPAGTSLDVSGGTQIGYGHAHSPAATRMSRARAAS